MWTPIDHSNIILYPIYRLSLRSRQVTHQAGAYPGFRGVKRLGVFLFPLDGMLVHRRFSPSIAFPGTHIYTRGERHYESQVSCPRIQCSAPARARTNPDRSIRSLANVFVLEDITLVSFQSLHVICHCI